MRKPRRYGGALEAAAHEGHERVVKVLLKHHNAPATCYDSALQMAVDGVGPKRSSDTLRDRYDPRKRPGPIFRLLLERGADVRMLRQDYINTLQLKPDMGFELVADCILEAIENRGKE